LKAETDFYYGRSGDNFDIWLDRFDRYGQALEWTDNYKRTVLPTFLRGPAEIVFNGIPADRRSNLTYNQLTDFLRSRFNPAHTMELRSAELHTRRQHIGEPVQDYAINIQRLTMEAYPDVDNKVRDQLMRRIFIAGLLPELWRVVIPMNPKSFTDAESQAKAAEAQLLLLARQSYQYSVLNDNSSGSRTFSRAQTPTRTGYRTNQLKVQFDRTVDGRPICFNCGIAGHIAVRCRKPQKEQRNPPNRFRQPERQPFRNNNNQRSYRTPSVNRSYTSPRVNAVQLPVQNCYADLQAENTQLRDQLQNLTAILSTHLNVSDNVQHSDRGDVMFSCDNQPTETAAPPPSFTEVPQFELKKKLKTPAKITLAALLLFSFFGATFGWAHLSKMYSVTLWFFVQCTKEHFVRSTNTI